MKSLFILLLFINFLFSNTNTIKIAISNNMVPYSFVDENGNPDGILVDYWKLWAKKNNHKIEFIASSWTSSIEKIKNGSVDIHSGLYMSEKRKKYVHYLEPIFNSTVHIFIDKKNVNQIKSIEDLQNKTMGVLTGTYSVDYIKSNYPHIKLKIFKTYNELLEAIYAKEIDSFIDESLIVWFKLIQRLKMNDFVKLPNFKYERQLYSGIVKNNKKLEKLTLEGIRNISQEDIIKIEKKWIYDDTLKYYQQQKDSNTLTQIERLWLQKNPIIELAVVKNWNLFSFANQEGRIVGFHLDLLNQINENLNIRLTYKAFKNWEHAYEAAKTKKVAGIFGLSWEKEREKYFKYSSVYHHSPYHIVTRNDRQDIKEISDFNNKIIAGEKNHIVNKSILEIAPNAKIIFKSGVKQILESIKNKESDATIINYAEKENVDKYNLKIGKYVETKAGKLSIGIDNSKLILSDIIEKGIRSITKNQMKKIEKKWLNEKENINIFTLEELDYIKNVPTLKLALEDWKPIIFSEKNKLVGIAGEIIAKAIEHSGLKFEYVTDDWTNLLNDFKIGKIDILPTTAYTKSRAEYGLFSDQYLTLNNFLYVKSSNKDIKSLKDLYQKRLAIINDYAAAELIKEKFPNIKIINTINLEESIKKVLNGKAEALIATQIVVQDKIKELMITNLKEISQNDIKPLNLHVYSKNGDVVLQSIMNKSLKRVTREEKNRIISKWINLSQEKKVNIVFTKQEEKYIKEHNIIKFSEINWKPLSIIDKNNFSGIFSDYMKIIEKRTGLRFKYIPSKNWDEVLDKFKSKEINFIPSVINSTEKRSLGLISDEYINFDFAIVSGKEGTYIRNIKNLKEKVLAIPKNYSSYNMIKANYKDIEIIETKDIKEALTLVAQKKAYAFIGHAPVVIYNIKNHFPELKIIGLSEEKFHHHFLVQKTDPEFLSILNKVISSITIEEKQAINNKWIKGEINTAIDYSIIYKMVFSFLVILTIVLVFTKKLSDVKNEIEKSKKKLENTLNSLKETQKKLIEAEKMASLGGLVAGVAHEINTPIGIGLTGITHFLYITEEIKNKYKLNNMSQEEFEDYLADSFTLATQINTNLKRTAELVKSFKQISIDQTNEEIREFNIRDYMNEILLSMNNILKKTNLKIELICEESLIIESYAGAFSQIITNLIINSIKHGYLKKENGNIVIEISKKDNYLTMVYKDDGKGISEDNLTKIFDPFFTTNRKGGGTGLGLNIIYNIVTSKLKGSITCNSKENKGVEFIIKFKEKEE